ncbi:branched-chain amino acid ABC transporter substrate-binding protein, partial [Burkholderia pseudomallei]
STDPAKIVAAKPNTNYTALIGTTTYHSNGDQQHGVITLYDYKGGKKTIDDEVEM